MVRSGTDGFSLVEAIFGMVLVGVLLGVCIGVFSLYQKHATQSTQFTDAQQNARVAADILTEELRQAGAGIDYANGQRHVAYAGPYQVAINADIDNGQTTFGQPPLSALDRNYSPYSVPQGGTPIYTPADDYVSGAETVVFSLDSNNDGVIDSGDQGDDPEEAGLNSSVLALKRVVYGFDGASTNQVRSSNVALVRGADPYPSSTRPLPLFQYQYDHDNNISTPSRLWGDTSQNGTLSDTEIATLAAMPDSLLPLVRKVRVTVISESTKYNKKFESNNGFLSVEVESEVYLRNSTRVNAVVSGWQ